MPPPKRVPQTDAIFEQLSRVNPQADEAPDTLRLSLDAKATVNVGLKQIAASVLETGAAYEMLSNQTRDHAEAVAAFRGKRAPDFSGN